MASLMSSSTPSKVAVCYVPFCNMLGVKSTGCLILGSRAVGQKPGVSVFWPLPAGVPLVLYLVGNGE